MVDASNHFNRIPLDVYKHCRRMKYLDQTDLFLLSWAIPILQKKFGTLISYQQWLVLDTTLLWAVQNHRYHLIDIIASKRNHKPLQDPNKLIRMLLMKKNISLINTVYKNKLVDQYEFRSKCIDLIERKDMEIVKWVSRREKEIDIKFALLGSLLFFVIWAYLIVTSS